MKCAVIDIGSNSVRLMISENGNTEYKLVETTRLGSSFDEKNNLCGEGVVNTFSSLSFFIDKANKENVDKIFVFATAAVRNANNKAEFKNEFEKRFGISLDILSGEEEAKVGLVGALDGKDGGIIDVGGASTEICVMTDGKISYSKSLPFGAVNLTKKFSDDMVEIISFLEKEVKNYGRVPKSDFMFIGGTASNVASMMLELKKFDAKITHGYVVGHNKLKTLRDELYLLPFKERMNLVGLQKERADVIQSGVSMILAIMDYLDLEKVIVSEKDNLEGYLAVKGV